MVNKIVLMLLVLSLFACQKEDLSPKANPVTDETYFEAFTMEEPHREILHDSFNHLLVLMDGPEGKIISYDYRNHKIVASTNKNFLVNRHQMSLYAEPGKSELYVSDGQSIFIHDAFTLKRTDEIEVFDLEDGRYISSIVSPNDDILIIGKCNASLATNNDGSISIDKKTKSIITQAQYGGNCLRIRDYQPEAGLIGVIGIAYGSTRPPITHDIYKANGTLVENDIAFFPVGQTGNSLLKIAKNADYFITSNQGTIYRKSDMEYVGALGGDYNDILISKDERLLYGFSETQRIDVFNAETLNLQGIRPLKNRPVKAFIADNQFIVVYFERKIGNDRFSIYMSVMDIT